MTWIIILFIVVILLFLLPMVPGIMELVRPTDIEPLRVSQDYDSDPFFFADGFRSYIKANFRDIHSTQNQNGRLPNDTYYQLVGERGIPNLDSDSITNKLVLTAHTLNLPAGEMFETEVYSRQGVMGGERSTYRAILADGTMMLRDGSKVIRWAHSDGDMVIGRKSTLYGRATSRSSILISDGTRFERLHAPKIMTSSRETVPTASAPELTILAELPDVRMQSGRRWVLNGHLEFPEKHEFDGDIVSGTTATIGDYAHIKGSIKSNAHDDIAHHLHKNRVMPAPNRKIALFDIGNHVRIDGSIVSTHDLFIGEDCRILGPVIADGLLVIGAGTVIGSPDHPTTVSAPEIIVENGVTVYGTLWASDSGYIGRAEDALKDAGHEHEIETDEARHA